ncbi:MAG: TIGR04076 family protein [Dehalococcoidia bacterium]|nr:TIGR04076 family protein [Dehalococcoidia bacterium]
MAERYKVSIRVVSQKGTCAHEHKVGDQWVTNGKTPGGICLSAFGALFPSLRVLMFGGAFPWEDDPDMTTVTCPDAANPVVFELRRLRE